MSLTLLRSRIDPSQMRCPHHDLPLRFVRGHGGIETGWRCLKCDASRNQHESLRHARTYQPFNGERSQMAREVRGLSLAELATQLACEPSALEAIEQGAMIPERTLQCAIADATQFPLAFFYQLDPPRFNTGFCSLDLHAMSVYCECGTYLGLKGETLPIECPDCMEPVDGCPKCDADMHPAISRRKATKGQRVYRCERCQYEMEAAQ